MAHISYEELSARLEEAKRLVKVGGKYRHYRSPESAYTVISLALQEDSELPCVVYRSSYSPDLIWVRNLDDWFAPVVNEAGETVRRFELIAE